MKSKKILKIVLILSIAIIAAVALVSKVFSDSSRYYVLDVEHATADSEGNTKKDDNLRITEKIKDDGKGNFDTETLNYEVTVSNKNGENSITQIAMVVDTSYSMQTNDSESKAKSEAKTLAQGIFDNLSKSANLQMSVFSNNGQKCALTNNVTLITNAINGLTTGESEDCNNGLQLAYDSLSGAAPAGKTLNKMIIYFTDSTDNVSQKMKDIVKADPTLKLVSVLVDLTSSSYLDLDTAKPVEGEVYVLPASVNESDILPKDVIIYDPNKIYDEVNLAANSVKVENFFDQGIIENFDISSSDFSATEGTTVTPKEENGKIIGYDWNVGNLKLQESKTLTFSIKLKSDSELNKMPINSKYIFEDIYTNEKQSITYKKYNTDIEVTMDGLDKREGTEATVIKICEGYKLKIKAVSDANSDLSIEGVKVNITGVDTNGKEICNVEKTTDSNGYVLITPDDSSALRRDGKIKYTITPMDTNNLVGYTSSDSMSFEIDNNKASKKLIFDDLYSGIKNAIIESTRTVEVEIPIKSLTLDLEIHSQELNNSNINIPQCKFELIQPKLNSKYEMSVLYGTTDDNGVLHFNPTVMTKDGTYNYILRQVSAPNGYEVTDLAMIKIEFKNGRIVTPSSNSDSLKVLYNDAVSAVLDASSKTSNTDLVKVFVGDESLKKDPFKIQINVADADDNTIKLEGVTYNITVTDSQGFPITQPAVTDENGQINIEGYGTGYLTLEIEEKSTKVGYEETKDKKEIILQHVNGKVTILSCTPTSIYNTNAYKTGYVLDGGNQIGVKVNLTSKKKTEQNIIKLKIVDSDQTYLPAGEDIVYELFDENNVSCGMKGTDSNGELKFTIGNREPRTYKYTLVPETMTAPAEYDTSKIETPINLDVTFDNNGIITNATKTSTTYSSVISQNFEIVNSNKLIENTYELTIGYYVREDATIKFTVLLRDEKNMTTPLDNAKYNIDIEYETTKGEETVTRTKKLVNRATNSFGKLSTIIPKSGNITVKVKEVTAKPGYALDYTEQEFNISCLSNGKIVINNQTPTSPKGAVVDSNQKEVIYYDYNRGRNSSDTYINLTLTKQDTQKAYVDGLMLEVESEKLLDGSGAKLDSIIATGSQTAGGKEVTGSIVYDYDDYMKKIPDSFTIKIPEEIKINEEGVYEFKVNELTTNDGGNTYVKKKNTEVKFRLIFRNKDGDVKLTNVETIYGNRLVIDKNFSSASDSNEGIQKQNELGVFLSNIQIDLYTNYDDVGNLSLDLKKFTKIKNSATGKEDIKLDGAEYDLKILNPDNSIVRKKIKIDNGDNSDSIELTGLNVYKGSIIQLTEIKAPTGYALNEATESFEVKSVDVFDSDPSKCETFEMEHIDNSYNPSRATLKQLAAGVNAAGNIKENYEIDLYDNLLQTFNMQIQTVDAEKNNVNGFTFDVSTDQGVEEKDVPVFENRTIGASPANTVVKYTIKPKKTAQYYKKIKDDIIFNVVFDANGNVDVSSTKDPTNQSDSNYNKTWRIKNLTQTIEGNLELEITVEHQPPLDVRVLEKDKITDEVIKDASYKITPSNELDGTGSAKNDLQNYIAKMLVGYKIEDGTVDYTLTQTDIDARHEKIDDTKFEIEYKDGEINKASLVGTTPTDKKAPKIEIKTDTNNNSKYVEIDVYAEPKVSFKVTNLGYFDNLQLQGAKFKITEQQKQESSEGTTDANGFTNMLNSTYGEDNSKIFKVEQITASKANTGYATVEDFYIKVDFDSNREITKVVVSDETGTEITPNRFLKVGFIDNPDADDPNTPAYEFQPDDVTIEVKNYPEFKINIFDYDRRDETTPIEGTKYKVTSKYEYNNKDVDFMKTDGVVTDSTGLGVAHLDRTKFDTIVTYTIIENTPGNGYQTIGTEKDSNNPPANNVGYPTIKSSINVVVEFDSDGYVKTAYLEDKNNVEVTNIAKVSTISGDTGKFQINLQLLNNPLLKINITSVDRLNTSTKIPHNAYTVEGYTDKEVSGTKYSTKYTNASSLNKVNTNGKSDSLYTDINGQVTAYMDRTLGNQEMKYVITHIKKAVGYEWLKTNPVELKVLYDAKGKIDGTPSVSVGDKDVVVESFDKDNFEINLTIYNDEIQEFGIHLTTQDTYDSDKKINQMKVEAFLTDGSTSYVSDGYHQFVGNDALLTGADRDNDGTPDLAYGEDYKSMGEYIVEGVPGNEGTTGGYNRILRLVVKNDSSPKGYYLDSADGSKTGKNVGHYRGSEYFGDSRYQTVKYQWLISVSFSDEGKITGANIISGLNQYIGWLTDDRYLEVSHTNYTLNVKMKFFPMLELNVDAIDNYVKGANGNNLKIGGGSYTISTQRHSIAGSYLDEFVTAGYIGYPEYCSFASDAWVPQYTDTDGTVVRGHWKNDKWIPEHSGKNGIITGHWSSEYWSGGKWNSTAHLGRDYIAVSGHRYEDNNTLCVPIENNYTRLFYVYEDKEPTNYQKYDDRHNIYYYQKMVAIISIVFDEYGEIDYDHSITRYLTDNSGNYTGATIPIYFDESGTGYLSSNNLKEYNYTYTQHPAKTTTTVSIGYALTTKIHVTAVDNISGKPLSNIKMYPFVNNTYKTNTSYEYGTTGDRNTNGSGNVYQVYWGAADPNTQDRYIWGSSRLGSDYNGYFFPDDMTKADIGGKGTAFNYYSKLDVTYDQDGRISAVTSAAKDLWGDDTTSDIKWNSQTGEIWVNILYCRQFITQLEKFDFYDPTIKLSAVFNVVSDKGVSTTMSPTTSSPAIKALGKVYKNETVKYTLSETEEPEGYYPIENSLDYLVSFDENGNITTNSISIPEGDSKNYLETIRTSSTTENNNKTNSPDLALKVKNKAAFELNLRLIDKFYKDDGIGDVKINVTNSKGDQAIGNPQTTGKQGYVDVLASPVYPDETVIYYIEQISKANGYYQMDGRIELEVTFNKEGKINGYQIVKDASTVKGGFNAFWKTNPSDGKIYKDAAAVNLINGGRNIGLELTNMPEDVKMGLYKFDEITNKPMDSVKFKVTKTNMNSGEKTEIKFDDNLITDKNGNILFTIDKFEERSNVQTYKYTIEEIETPKSYRTMENIEFIVIYNTDGSIQYSSAILSNGGIQNTKASINVSKVNTKLGFNGEKVHMILNVPNDNAFDLIIKDEDANYAGFGITGTKYDVSIDGIAYTPSETNSNGETYLSKITDTGKLTINISEKEAGDGYATNLTNKATVVLNKGQEVYSLDLDDTQEGKVDNKNATITKEVILNDTKTTITKAIIKIDEEHGKVYVTFKNESKLEITVFKKDFQTLEPLKGAQFEITAQQVNSISGDNIGEPITITTTGVDDTTDANGNLHFDLGIAPQSQKWVYTFKEITAPEGYNNLIPETKIVATFDQYGRVTLDKSTSLRMDSSIIHTDSKVNHNSKNCRSIVATIYNGEVPPGYKVKVYKKDAQTGKTVNGAGIQMKITDQNGIMIPITPKTQASGKNGQVIETSNIGLDGQIHTDKEVKEGGIILADSGVAYIDNIDYEGTVNIQVSEAKAPLGYIIGGNKTSGNVQIEAKYTLDPANFDANVDLKLINNDGLDVSIDSVKREIIINLYDDPQVAFHITDLDFDNGAPVQGVYYVVTSIKTTVDSIVPTDLKVTSPTTDENGKVDFNAGVPYAGQTLIYTLHQNTPAEYQPLVNDIELQVQFDANGNVISCMLLNNNDMATVVNPIELSLKDPNLILGKVIYLTVKNRRTIPDYKVQVEKHIIDNGIEKTDFSRILPGATYKVIVHQEDGGKEYTKFTATTDSYGLIDIPDQYFTATGNITVTIQEIIAPDGYELNGTPQVLKFYRDPLTGNMTEISTTENFSYKFINTDSPLYSTGQPVKVVLQPFDKQDGDKFTLRLNKYSTLTGKNIENNHAKFTAAIIQEEAGDLKYEYNFEQELETDDMGNLMKENLQLPTEPGEYKLVLTETEAPSGYVIEKDPIEFMITIDKDSEGFPIITKAIALGKDKEGKIIELKGPTDENPFAIESRYQFLSVSIGNTPIPGYKVMIEKHTLDTDIDLNAYERTLPGATYEVLVHEEDAGTEDVKFVETSDANGIIDIPDLVFHGFGYITVKIKELKAPYGYVIDDTERITRLYRDPETGNLQEISSNVNYTLTNTTDKDYVKGEPVKAILKPVDRQETGMYTIQVNKFANKTKELITDSSARFRFEFIKEATESDPGYQSIIGTYDTKDGKFLQSGLKLPDENGDYILKVTETNAPAGYAVLNSPIIIKLKVGEDKDHNKIIEKAETDNKNVNLIARNQYILLQVFDYTEDELQDDEYSLDITKVDAETNQPIANMALFKVWLPDKLNTAVYTETSQTVLGPGKLDYCFVEQDKDYSVRLTHMNQPAGPGKVQYIFREVVAPEGYDLIKEDLVLTIDFEYDENGKLRFESATSSDPNYLRINTPTPSPIDKSFSVDILNYLSKEDDLYLKSKEYVIGDKPDGWTRSITETEYKDGDRIISKVEPRTTLADFLSNLDTNGTPTVTKSDGTAVGLGDYVGTNMKLTVTKGDKKIELTISVRGDVSEDGEVTLQDYSDLKHFMAKKIKFTEAEIIAVDSNEDGKITLQDYSEEKHLLVEQARIKKKNK